MNGCHSEKVFKNILRVLSNFTFVYSNSKLTFSNIKQFFVYAHKSKWFEQKFKCYLIS